MGKRACALALLPIDDGEERPTNADSRSLPRGASSPSRGCWRCSASSVHDSEDRTPVSRADRFPTVAAIMVQGGVLTTMFASRARASPVARGRAGSDRPSRCARALRELDPSTIGSAGRPRIATISLEEENTTTPRRRLRELTPRVLVLLEVTKPGPRGSSRGCGDYIHRWLAAATGNPHAREELRSRSYRACPRPAITSREPASSAPRSACRCSGTTTSSRCMASTQALPFTVYRGRGATASGSSTGSRTAAHDRRRRLQRRRAAFVQRLRKLGLANASEAVCGRAPVTWPMNPTCSRRFAP
jgi:hypothetical protein